MGSCRFGGHSHEREYTAKQRVVNALEGKNVTLGCAMARPQPQPAAPTPRSARWARGRNP